MKWRRHIERTVAESSCMTYFCHDFGVRGGHSPLEIAAPVEEYDALLEILTGAHQC
jgi:hypothetical protein